MAIDKATRDLAITEARVLMGKGLTESEAVQQIMFNFPGISRVEAQNIAHIAFTTPVREEPYFYVNILSPQDSQLINIETDTTSESQRNRFFHKRINFYFQITGGKPPFRYETKVRRIGPRVPHEYNDHFWPYRRDGNNYVPVRINQNLNENRVGEERIIQFFKGGDSQEEFHPFREDDDPNAQMTDSNGSLPEGRYEIKVIVKDDDGNGKETTATSTFQIVSKPRSRLHAVITSPVLSTDEEKAMKEKGIEAVPSYKVRSSNTSEQEYSYTQDEEYSEGDKRKGKNKYHDEITFDCSVDGGSGRYYYEWFIQDVRHVGDISPNAGDAPVKLPLRFLGVKNFSIGGTNHPIEEIPEGNHERVDPRASLPEGLYRVILRVTDRRGLNVSGMTGGGLNVAQNASSEATAWIRIGEEQGPTTRSLSSYVGMRPGVARIGGGWAGGPRGAYTRRQAVTGISERAMHRVQHPMSGSGRALSFIKNEKKEGTGTWGKEGTRGTIRSNIAVQSAVNQGKRELNRWARQMFSPEFQRLQRELRTLTDTWRNRRREWLDIRNQARRQYGRWRDYLKGQGGADALTNSIAVAQQRGRVNEVQARLLTDQINQAYNRFTKSEEDLLNFSHSKAGELHKTINDRMEKVAEQVAGRIIYRFKIRDTAAAKDIENELKLEAGKIAKSMVEKGRDTLSGPLGMIRSASMGAKTVGATYYSFWEFWREILTAPFIWGTLFAIVQYLFILTYVGYNPTYLLVYPIITALFTFLVYFGDLFEGGARPFDLFNHLASGAIIGYTAVLLMLAFGFQTFVSTGWFWGIWIFFSLVGIFQFYHSGGFRIVLQGGVIILLFAYIALGPYSGYYHQAIDQVRGPVVVAYDAVEKTISDVYLLATNPTEWYARQQVQNVRPERSTVGARALEITLFDALPASVPAGQQFAVTTVLKHEGVLDNVTDMKVAFSCNQWCLIDGVTATDSDVGKTSKGKFTINNAAGGRSILLKGESIVASFSGFISKSVTNRENEYRLAKVTMNVSYRYSTTSSLFVEAINSEELNKRTNEGKNFRNVVATGKNGPAQLSLNVGPQPLIAGKNALLLVSVSNSRDDSSVILNDGTEITIRMPRSVGSGLDCEGFGHNGDDGDPDLTGIEVVRYKVTPKTTDRVEIKASDFNSIFPFICSFTANEVRGTGPLTQTGLVTAELPSYEFTVKKEKDVPVTVPLGILFDPYDAVCRQCGSTGLCDAAECQALSSDRGTCYFEDRGAAETGLSQRCYSCGEAACEQFRDDVSCLEESKRCGLSNCGWDGDAKNEIGVTTGKCFQKPYQINGNVSSATLSGDVVEKIIQVSKASGFNEEDTKRVLAVAAQESGFRMVSGDGGNSAGVFQLNKKAHPMWFDPLLSGCPEGQTAMDEDCNIKLGVDFIKSLHNQHFSSPPKQYACRNVQYSGWDAVFRYYNGWANDCSGDPDYISHVNGWLTCRDKANCVENILVKKIDDARGYESLMEAVFAGKGSVDFCREARVDINNKANSWSYGPGLCIEGEGGCEGDGQCGRLFEGGRIDNSGICVKPGHASYDEVAQPFASSGKLQNGAGICCWTDASGSIDANKCKSAYSQWFGSSPLFSTP
ncbi:MAG: rhomboid family intramembrane serine protease [Candidatus Aenigmarchaeota archaeon]|nr:rhomboid family intramembrane serine protease [Candidatus Aenigmarchaeota archaeon]